MTDIWLMRHGAYEGHRPGYHAPHEATLTMDGCDGVRRSLPLPDSITAIVTSPIPRARQTASLISHLTGLPIVATSGLLAEWRAPSIVLGRTPETYPPMYRAWRARRLANPCLRCEDGESLTDLHTRARYCAAFLHHAAHRHGPVLAVSHTLLLGVLTHLAEGPTAFTTAARSPWRFAERRLFTSWDRPATALRLHKPAR
ncbi:MULTISPECIES: histidine phosphatase family protein [Streptomyces]|uniref:histidine phosphatase family protein n=1 Tax=Streptomyces TaxID=1883 RepID=UPI002DD87769|nr:histidine phosphatase family protein [Streptomyces sp. NBC_01022]WRZ86072.1 histidine phosphatase family protein [Streptomyces sp. NBC_01022]